MAFLFCFGYFHKDTLLVSKTEHCLNFFFVFEATICELKKPYYRIRSIFTLIDPSLL
jgi:hypothetical protein